jgi:hypothetical protein
MVLCPVCAAAPQRVPGEVSILCGEPPEPVHPPQPFPWVCPWCSSHDVTHGDGE